MMKKIITSMVLATLLTSVTPCVSQAFFGGGISGPLPVYNLDKTVDAATIATQINTAQQLEAALSNLATMDPATAAANKRLIYSNLQQLIDLQNNMSGLVMDYSNFQNAWDSQYHDFADYNGMNNDQYAQNAQNLLTGLNQSLYNAMSAQGLVAQNGDIANQLQTLLQASQTSEGALAAAQVGNQLAALQAQQMIQFQQIIAQSNRAQSEWIAMQTHKEAMAREINETFFQEADEPIKGQGPGFTGFNK